MLIFLFGADSFRSKEKLNEIQNKFLEKNSSGSGLSVLDYEEKATANDLKLAVSSGSLFTPKILVIVRNCISSGALDQQKEIVSFLKKDDSLSNDSDRIVVFWEASEPRKNNSLYKLLVEKSKKQQFSLLDAAKLSIWISQYIKKADEKTSIDKNAADLLISYIGNDLMALSSELEKLIAYKFGQVITKEDVDLLVKSQSHSTIFQTIESVCSGNKARALDLLHQLLSQGEDPFYILSMYVYQFRNLLKTGGCMESGNTNQYAIAKEAGLHPFVVQKGMQSLRNMPFEEIKLLYQKLLDIDVAVKTGKTTIHLALDTFVAEL